MAVPIYLLFFIAFASISTLAQKFSVTNIHPDYANLLNTILWASCIAGAAGYQLQFTPFKIESRSALIIMLLTGVLCWASSFFLVRSIATYPVAYVLVGRNVAAVVSAVIAYFLFNENINWKQWISISGVVVCGYLVVYFKD